MKHIASLVKDGRVHYAVVDEDTGQLVPFAEILLPFPDSFGLAESAVLGSNLVDAVGLNGKRPSGRSGRQALPPRDQPRLALESTDGAEGHVPPAHSSPEPERKPKRRQGRPSTRAYIPMEMVMEIVREHPEGIGCRDIADEALRRLGVPQYIGEHWAQVAVSNRFTNARGYAERHGSALPFRTSEVPKISRNGPTNLMLTRYHPVGSG